MNYTITNDPVNSFNLNYIKSFGAIEGENYLEMKDLWGEIYRKFYRNREDLLNDCDELAQLFNNGRY